MTKEFKFDLASRVFIPDLKLRGTIVSISITQTGTQYETRYFCEGKHQFAFLYEWELDSRNITDDTAADRISLTTGTWPKREGSGTYISSSMAERLGRESKGIDAGNTLVVG